MKSIAPIMALLLVSLLTGPSYASSEPSSPFRTSEGLPTPMVLCLDHKVGNEFVDAWLSPVYDWVHAGQQGIQLTFTNKTHREMVIDWDRSLFMQRSDSSVGEDRSVSAVKSGGNGLPDIVGPGDTLTKIMWPSASTSKVDWFYKPVKVENRTLYLTITTNEGKVQHEEVMLHISGQQLCSK